MPWPRPLVRGCRQGPPITALHWGGHGTRLSNEARRQGAQGLTPSPSPSGGAAFAWAHSPAWSEGPGEATHGCHEGTFPSHLELSKSRSHSQAWLQDLPWAPSPRTGATQTHGGCAQQMWAWETARNPTGRSPSQSVSEARAARPPALRTSLPQGLPCPWGLPAGTSLPFNSRPSPPGGPAAAAGDALWSAQLLGEEGTANGHPALLHPQLW